MTNRVIVSKNPNAVPNTQNLTDKQLGVNTADGKLYTKDATGIKSINGPTIKEVSSPYTLLESDSGDFLVFNTGGQATVNIPDGLRKGVSVCATNIGGGGLGFTLTTETVRGANSIGDVDGFMSFTKITTTVWQSSERI